MKAVIPTTLLVAWAITASCVVSTTSDTSLDEHNLPECEFMKPGRCLKDIKEVTPRKFFQLENETLSITLETSALPGHQLVTAAFRIFLEEVLGYGAVCVKTYKDNFNTSQVLHRLAGPDGYRNAESMVNLAVWVPPDVELEEWTSPGHVENCGHLGFPGRFGWFIPNTTVYRENPDVDYWRTFSKPKIASLFSLSGEDLELVISKSKDKTTGRFFCEASYCDGGIFEPETCKPSTRHQKGHQCAVLLASYPG